MKNTIIKYAAIAVIVAAAAFTGGNAGSEGGGVSDLFKLATDETALVKTCESLVKDGKVTVTTTVQPSVTVLPEGQPVQ